MGAEPAGPVADLGDRRGPVRRPRRARPTICPRPTTSTARSPSSRAAWCCKKCDAERARKIDLLLLSIGGNDVGFSRLVANAVLSDKSMLRSLGGWFGQVHGFAEAGAQLDALDDRFKSLNRALHNILHVPWPESDRIILTAYPPMALLDDGKSVCPDGRAGMDVLPDFALSEAKAREGSAVGRAPQRRHARQRAPVRLDVRRRASPGLPRPRHLRRLHRRAVDMADDLRLPRKVDGALGAVQPCRLARLCARASAGSARPTTRS